MLYLQKKYSLLTLLTRILIKTARALTVVSWCSIVSEHTIVSLLAAQEIEHSQQIAISPKNGFIGDEITAKCSSESLRPGVHLSLQWFVREGESNTTTTLGGCEAHTRGFQKMSCSAFSAVTGSAVTGSAVTRGAVTKITVTEPYEQEPDYAVSTINYRTTEALTTLVCVLGNGYSLEMSPELITPISIENLHMLCENGKSTLKWKVKGSADRSQVNFNNSTGWRNTTLTSLPYTVTRADHWRNIVVRGINDRYELSSSATIALAIWSYPRVWQYTCSSYIYLPYNGALKPPTLHVFMNDLNVDELTLIEESYVIINIPEQLKVPSYAKHNGLVNPDIPMAPEISPKIVITWDCYQATPAEIKSNVFSRSITDVSPSFAVLGPEQLTLGCLTNEEDNRVSLPLHWIHPLYQEEQRVSIGGKPNIYHVVVAHEGRSEAYVATIDFADHPSDENHRRLYSMPQSITLPLQKGNIYQVSITPNYRAGILFKSICHTQTLTRNITIPTDTPVKQLSETSVELQNMGLSSGYHIALFNQQSETAIAEYDDQNGSENLLITDLALDQNYTAEIVYNGTDTIPCRSETIQFFLTAVPSPSYSELIAETTDTSMVFTSIAIPLSTSLDSAAPSSMMSTPFPTPFPTSIPTAFEESTDPIQPASKDSPISLYIAGAIWSGVIVFAGILITINVCTRAKKK